MVGNFASPGESVRSQVQTCALCTTPVRYKCPRCATPTCSLPCSRKHKENTGCIGERDKTRYVPMNAYNWGTMMRDYCYLEEVGRRVSEWGDEVVRGGYVENISARKTPSVCNSSTWRKSTTAKSKREILRAHLEMLDIDVELLPAGMERRNLNQSTFDQKSKRFLLTIEFVFHPPTTLASISSSPPPSYKMLSHRNSLSTVLLTVLQHQVSLTLSKPRKQKEDIPEWLPSLVTPHPEAPECFIPPHCYIRANTEFLRAPNTAYYHKLEPILNLNQLLQKTYFTEFPTIHVFDPEASSFCGTVIDKSGSIARVFEDNQVNVATAMKRRKLDQKVNHRAVFNLIDGYGSEDSCHSEQETANQRLTGLAMLGAYSGSDDGSAPADAEAEEDQSLHGDDESIEGKQLDPARLLGFMEQARSAADEDILDWRDEWGFDAEGSAVVKC